MDSDIRKHTSVGYWPGEDESTFVEFFGYICLRRFVFGISSSFKFVWSVLITWHGHSYVWQAWVSSVFFSLLSAQPMRLLLSCFVLAVMPLVLHFRKMESETDHELLAKFGPHLFNDIFLLFVFVPWIFPLCFCSHNGIAMQQLHIIFYGVQSNEILLIFFMEKGSTALKQICLIGHSFIKTAYKQICLNSAGFRCSQT